MEGMQTTNEIRTALTATEAATMIASKLKGIEFVSVVASDRMDWIDLFVSTRGGLLEGSNGVIRVYPTKTGSVAKLQTPMFHGWTALQN